MSTLLFLALSVLFEHSSSLVFGGDFRSAVMDSERIYVVDGRGLSVFALSNMQRLGDSVLKGYSRDIGMWGTNLYVAGSRGLVELNFDPGTGLQAGQTWLAEKAISALAVSGDTLWYSDADGNLYGKDLASGSVIPNTPFALAATPMRIVPSGKRLYLAADTAGLFVVDLDARTPEAKRLDIEGDPAVFDVLPLGNLVYLAAGDDGLWVAEPKRNSARVVFKVNTDGQVRELAVFGDRIAAASGTADMSIFSIADPGKPVLSQEESMPGLGTGLAVRDSLVLLLTGVGFGKVDLSIEPKALQGIFYKRAGSGYDILAKGDVAVIAVGEGGIRTVGAGGDALTFLGAYSEAADARRIYLFGSQVFVLTAANLLKLVEIKNPGLPEKRTFLQFESTINGLDAEGEMVLTAEDARGVGSFWRCPCGPLKEQGRLSVDGRALDIKIFPQSKLAFVSSSPGALDVVSWKDSTSMEIVEKIPLTKDYEKLYLDGDLLFGLDYSGALTIVNVSRPTRPKELAVLDLGGTPSGLARDGDTLYIASGDAGVFAVDISKPSSPQVVATIDIDGAKGAAVSEGHLLVLTPYAIEAYNLK